MFLCVFLPAVLILYYLCPRKFRNLLLLAVSLLFYAWGEPVYILLMLFTIAVDYASGLLIDLFKRREKQGLARATLIVTVVINLGLLGFFKYTDFLIGAIDSLTGLGLGLLRIALPIGISFYTFQTLSYTIDVYWGNVRVQKNPIDFAMFVTFFPQLIAGPIVRYSDIENELSGRKENPEQFVRGVFRFLVGLGKKVILADRIGAVFEAISKYDAGELTTVMAWTGALAFMFQIYFDFSGYSDMAIGMGQMFGFTFPENFDYPYEATSITDFWRRWHITLSTWFREYVYIPLGGNRRGRARQYFNLAVVWLLTGLWHGASWNFVLWGLFYLILLVAEKAFLLRLLERNRLTRVLGHIGALLLVGIGWMIFDHTDLGEAFRIIGGLFGIGTAGFAAATVSWQALRLLPLLAVSVAAATPYPTRLWNRLTERRPALTVLEPVLLVAVLALSVACAVRSDYSPFLYFNF